MSEVKNILVTGGAGFIGSRIVHELRRRHPGAFITVIDNFSSGDFRNLEGFEGDVLVTTLGERSQENERLLTQLSTQGLDLIFHQAAITDTSIDHEKEVFASNVESLKQMLELSRRTEAKLIYASSSAVYGHHPTRKMTVGKLERPCNVYGFSKLVADNYIRSHISDADKVVGLRYFNVYGPGEEHKGRSTSFVRQIYEQLNGDNGAVVRGRNAQKRVLLFKGTDDARRDWVHVRDVVKANLLAVDAPNGIYNVGSGNSDSFAQLVSCVARHMKLGPNDYIVDEIPNQREWCYQKYTKADLEDTAKKLAGYNPERSEEGIARYVSGLMGDG